MLFETTSDFKIMIVSYSYEYIKYWVDKRINILFRDYHRLIDSNYFLNLNKALNLDSLFSSLSK